MTCIIFLFAMLFVLASCNNDGAPQQQTDVAMSGHYLKTIFSCTELPKRITINPMPGSHVEDYVLFGIQVNAGSCKGTVFLGNYPFLRGTFPNEWPEEAYRAPVTLVRDSVIQEPRGISKRHLWYWRRSSPSADYIHFTLQSCVESEIRMIDAFARSTRLRCSSSIDPALIVKLP